MKDASMSLGIYFEITRTVTGAERSSPGTEKHTQTATTHI